MSFALLGIGWFSALGCGGSAAPSQQQQQISKADVALKGPSSLQKMLESSGLYVPGPKDSAKYLIGPEDLLEVNIYGQQDLNRVVRVDREGMIKLPLVGEVKVSDRNPLETEKMLEELYGRKYLRNPQVTVFIKEYRHRRVSVVGAVNKPGTFEMIGPRTLFEMLSEAGGLKEDAGDIVHIIRRGSADARKASSRPAGTPPEKAETIIVNLRSALTKGDTELGALPIQHGDVINVPHAGYAYVTGEVLKPGKVMVKQGLTVTQAVAMAGPLTPVASGQAQVLRFDPQGQRQVIPVDLQSLSKGEGLDIPIQENDVVVIPSSAGKKFWQGIASIFRGAVSVGYHLTP